MELFVLFITSIIMVIISCWIFYEILYFTWKNIDKIHTHKHRFKIFFIVIAIFSAHTICVWLYGLIYYLLSNMQIGEIVHFNSGLQIEGYLQYVYYSAATYSSLGFGDYVPRGGMQFLSGVEVLNGLVLIGWSASYTYLSMEKFWLTRNEKKL